MSGVFYNGCFFRWPDFITDLVLLNPSCAVRVAAAEQLIVICTCGAASRLALQLIMPLLFSLVDSMVLEYANNSHEFFQLLSRLVSVAYLTACPLNDAGALLANEVKLLSSILSTLFNTFYTCRWRGCAKRETKTKS